MKRTLCGVAMAILALSGQAVRAGDLSFDFANVVGSKISFASGGTFSFSPGGSGDCFTVTSASANLSALVGQPGKLTGTYTIGAIAAVGGFQSAPVAGTGTFGIKDSAGNWLTASTTTWHDIFAFGTTGGINAGGAVNLAGWTYSGTDADFLEILDGSNQTANITFNFIPGKSLTTLKSSGGSTSYSGSFNGVPVPSSLVGIASLGLAGAVVAWRRWTIAA